MDLLKKRPVRIAEILEDSFLSIPRTFRKMFLKLSKITSGLSLYLFDYFSTETGRKNFCKTISIKELKKNLGVSQSSIIRAIKEIIENKIFLIYEDTFNFFGVKGFFDCPFEI